MAQIKSLLDVPEEKRVPMTQKDTEIFAKCFLMELNMKDQKADMEFKEEEANQFGRLALVLFKRLHYAGTKVSAATALFVTHYSQGSPGNAVLWAWTLHQMWLKQNRIVNLQDLAESFPFGFPTEEAIGEIWDAQKVHLHNVPRDSVLMDNMLDAPFTWKENPSETPKEYFELTGVW